MESSYIHGKLYLAVTNITNCAWQSSPNNEIVSITWNPATSNQNEINNLKLVPTPPYTVISI